MMVVVVVVVIMTVTIIQAKDDDEVECDGDADAAAAATSMCAEQTLLPMLLLQRKKSVTFCAWPSGIKSSFCVCVWRKCWESRPLLKVCCV